MKRKLAIVVLLAATPAFGQTPQCTNALRAYGMFTQSAFICDTDWLSRPAISMAEGAIKLFCEGLPDEVAKPFLREGIASMNMASHAQNLVKFCLDENAQWERYENTIKGR